jgi:type VI secretion system protein ImpK
MDGESFLAAQFRRFYREVARYKTQVSRRELGDLVPRPEDAENGDGGRLASAAIGKSLLSVLERQALAVRRQAGDYALKVYSEAQYVMAALADEIFLHMDWAGRDAWQANLLESRLFQSHRAGEEIFERLEILLRNRNPVYRGLAEVYLLALGLGFQGRFRGREDGEVRLSTYRRRLFEFLYDRDPELGSPAVHLFPQAYANTLDPGESRQLPYLRPWIFAFVALFALWALISIPIWDGLVDDLEPILGRILN